MQVAILLTCHNRKKETVDCLKKTYRSLVTLDKYSFDVYLVDDGSSDGTSKKVSSSYPLVNIIHGTGKLYWNQGMRLAWKKAVEKKKYDFYIWLNDDTKLDSYAMSHIFNCYDEAFKLNEKANVIVGSCRDNLRNNQFSYGVRNECGPIIPNGYLQKGKYINGNFVLVPKEIYVNNGILSDVYSHGFGDIDYGLRVLEKGYGVYTTKKYVATCAKHTTVEPYFDSSISILDRFKHLNSKKGHSIREVIYFRKRFWGWKYIIYLFLLVLRVTFPKFYNKIKSFKIYS